MPTRTAPHEPQTRNATQLHELAEAPLPRSWGWPVRGGGRAAHVEAGARYTATTSQACGLFPFAVAAGSDVRGVPIGRHMHTAEPIGLDPAHWLRAGLVSNTGVWLQGQPGIGKSAFVKRLLTGLIGFGMRAVIPGDSKGEYTPLIDKLGGSVWRIGRGLHTLNPIDAGPLQAAVRASTGTERARLTETIRARRLSLLEALISIVRRRDATPTERRLLGTALDLACVEEHPVIPDVLTVLVAGHAPLPAIAAAESAATYARETRDLTNTLGVLCEGAIRGLFDRPSTVQADLDTPALALDISALDEDDDDIVAAAMLCSWAWTAALIDATTATGTHRPVVQVQDELWRALRVAPGLVEKTDRITRLGRHRGIVSVQVTHSLDDLRALPTEADRAKARGLASRAGVLVLGGMAATELDGLTGITPLTEGERALVTSWAAPPTWHPGRTHPGRGKYLIKSGQRTGLPVSLALTPTEAGLYETDRAFDRGTAR
jgi:hypothetical protein